jgi:type VI secretion system protein ImpI/type VI secretion system protein
MATAGELFRCLIEGIMEVLRARAEMKSEFRVSVTTIRSVDNNPLKFNPDVENVLKLMLGPHNPAFMPANKAVTEAVSDIKQHQLAMTAGIQASLSAMLKSFSPDNIEKGLGDGLIFQKKARCWELYCEKYPHMKSRAMEEFFGDAFVEAYEKQMRLLDRH